LPVHRGPPNFAIDRARYGAMEVDQMNSHRIRTLRSLALAAAVLSTGALAQGYRTDGSRSYQYGDVYRDIQTLRCESLDERTRYCPADIRGDVRLVNRLSRSGCTEGRSWGWDRQGIWVADGCRAEFEIDNRRYSYDQDDRNRRDYGRSRTLRCESHDNRTRYCDADTRYGVRLLTQHSRDACIEGRTWGWNDRGVWVTDGCRAQFQVGGRGYDDGRRYDNDYRHDNGYGNTYARQITCESRDERYNFCRTGTIRNVEVRRQLSNSDCRYNYSWGFRSDGVWVDRGCRAEFTVY
jgi:hypothetical protein